MARAPAAQLRNADVPVACNCEENPLAFLAVHPHPIRRDAIPARRNPPPAAASPGTPPSAAVTGPAGELAALVDEMRTTPFGAITGFTLARWAARITHAIEHTPDEVLARRQALLDSYREGLLDNQDLYLLIPWMTGGRRQLP